MLQVYIDDSGRGHGPAFVLSGFLAASEVWEKFSRDWQTELAWEPAVQYFKMKEAASRTGQFAGHSRELVEFRVSKLVSIIERHELRGVTVAVDREAFSRIVVPYAVKQSKEPHAKMFRNPYFHCFYELITMILYAHKSIGVVEPHDFIFDEQGKEGRAVRDFWYVLRLLIPEDDVRGMLVNEPVFRDDKVFLPLQAADLSAWQVRNLLSAVTDSDTGVDLNPVMARLAAIPHLEYMLHADRLQSRMNEFARLESLL